MVRPLIPVEDEFRWPMGELRRCIEGMLEDLFGDSGGTDMVVEEFVPRANVAEHDNGYEIEVDLPGVKPDDLNVECRGSELWLTGESKHEKEDKGNAFHRTEKRYGRFERVIPLAFPVDKANISVESRGGMLHVTVPKAEEAWTKRIEVELV